jgi:hypothetical protein
MVFGVLGLVLALAIVGVLMKKQLHATGLAGVGAVPAVAATGAQPAATVREQSQNIQRKVQDDIARAMQQAAPARAEEPSQ